MEKMSRFLVVLAIFLSAIAPAMADVQPADKVADTAVAGPEVRDSISILTEQIAEADRRLELWNQKQKNAFKPEYVIVPGSMIAVGIFGTYNDAFQEVNHHIKDGMKRLRDGRKLHFDDYIQYIPVVAYAGLGAVGVRCKHDFKERMAAGLTAYAAMAIIVNAGKYSFKVKRPDASTRNSFPSGHSGVVFTGAELMREEYGNAIGAAAYAVAATVGFMRMYNERHWLSDVIAGAGIGILSARIGYWMLPVWQRVFKWDKKSAKEPVMVALPGYDPEARALSMSFAMTF